MFLNTQDISKVLLDSQKAWDYRREIFPGVAEGPVRFPCIHVSYTEVTEDRTYFHHCFIYPEDFVKESA